MYRSCTWVEVYHGSKTGSIAVAIILRYQGAGGERSSQWRTVLCWLCFWRVTFTFQLMNVLRFALTIFNIFCLLTSPKIDKCTPRNLWSAKSILIYLKANSHISAFTWSFTYIYCTSPVLITLLRSKELCTQSDDKLCGYF